MMVKVCGITRREDALAGGRSGRFRDRIYFLSARVRAMSTPERAAALGEGLDIWKVGVFVDETPRGNRSRDARRESRCRADLWRRRSQRRSRLESISG